MQSYGKADALKGWGQMLPALYQPDGVHLTALGAGRVAGAFVQLLQSSADERLTLLRTVFQGD